MEKLFAFKTIFFQFMLVLILQINMNLANEYGQLVDYVSLPLKDLNNVSCVLHETKFTCDCGKKDETMNLSPLSGHAYQISVTNCKSLIVATNFLQQLQGLRTITFFNVENLVLKENSLSFSQFNSNVQPVLKFEKVQIEKIESHAINGKIGEITFNSGSIGTIRPYGISTKNVDGILKFDSMFIDRIEPQAFKKFTVDKLEIINSFITSNLQTKSIYDVKVNNVLKIQNVTFREVHTNAFTLEDVSKLIISNNKFDYTNGEWILSPIKSSILIENNNFGVTNSIAFRGLTVHKDFKESEYLDIRFFNNTVISIETDPSPLQFNRKFSLNLKDLYYLNKFPCHLINNENDNKKTDETLFKKFSDTIYFQSNKASTSSANTTFTIKKLLEEDCSSESHLAYMIGGSIALIIIVILIISLIIYIVIRKRNLKKAQKLDIVVPEPRTYKETQIVLQIENAGLLKTDL